MTYQNKRSPWVYVGIGCAVLLSIALIASLSVGYFGYRFVKSVESGLTDPDVKEVRALSLLNVEELPAGYHPAVSDSIPFVMDLLLLSDKSPDSSGEVDGFDKRGFIYLNMFRLPGQREQLVEFLEGRNEDLDVLEETDIGFERHDFLGRGRFDLWGDEVLYASYRGDIEIEKNRIGGIATMFSIDCPDRGRLRVGIWFGPDPGQGPEAEPSDLKGTPADEETLRQFLGQFHLCGK